MKKILINTYELSMTGGTKSTVLLAEELHKCGYNVEFLLNTKKNQFEIFEDINIYSLDWFGVKKIKHYLPGVLEDNVEFNFGFFAKVRVFVNKTHRIKFILKWLRYFKNLLKLIASYRSYSRFFKEREYDYIITNNMYSELENFFLFKRYSKLIVTLRNSPNDVYQHRVTPRILPLSNYYKDTYCVGVSLQTTKEMKLLTPYSNAKFTTIYNPFNRELILNKSKERVNIEFPQYGVVLGSLCSRKRVDLAIKAFSKIGEKNVGLLIIGDGELKNDLIDLSLKLGVEDKVVFIGNVNNPYKYLAKSSFLLLTSESEGLPRVLIEGLICETPLISTNCPTGPSEVMLGSRKEFLIPIHEVAETDVIDNLSRAIIDTLNGKNKGYYEGDEDFLSNFLPEQALNNWQYILEK